MPTSLPAAVQLAWGWFPPLAFLTGTAAVVAVALSRRRSFPRGARPPSSWLGGVLLTSAALAAVITETQSGRNGVPGPLSSLPHAHLLVQASRLLVMGIPLVAVACGIACAGERLAQGGSRITRSAAATALPFACAWAMSAGFGAWSGANAQAWAAWATFTALACLPVAGTGPAQQARVLLRVLIWGSLVLAVLSPSWAFAPYQLWPGGWRVGAPRLQGLMPQPNPLGWLAAFAVLLEWSHVRRLSLRLAWTAPALACLLLSASRTALFALVVGGLFYESAPGLGAEQPRVNSRWTRRAALAAAAAGLAILFLGSGAPAEGTLNGRTGYWLRAVELWRRYPLLGTGPGAFYESHDPAQAVGYAHNQLLHTAAELGTLGLLALVWFTTRALSNTCRSVAGRRVALPVLVTLTALYATENPLRFTNLTFVLPILPPLLMLLAAQGAEPAVVRADDSCPAGDGATWAAAPRQPVPGQTGTCGEETGSPTSLSPLNSGSASSPRRQTGPNSVSRVIHTPGHTG
ncbi:O-antigen ligase family protein [Streptacidiphilus sp. EB103A]|uniref:O-antigen ligase family protein n=1 Tax=Streptacidiphilus sp. EB103A TaxID=3156275 RepID=UPI00351836EF